MRTYFQPIFDLGSGHPVLLGAECLTRGIAGSNLEPADILFSYAREKRSEVAVDRAALSVAFESIRRLGLDLEFHVNVHASTLGLDPTFADFVAEALERSSLRPEQLTIEVVEQSEYLDRDTFTASIEALRSSGLTIALDDVGLGRSNYLMIYLTRPDVLKADRFFVHGIADDPLRHAVFVSIQRVAEELGARVVAEGLEREVDLVVLRDLGVRLFQGFLLSPPLEPRAFLAALEAGELVVAG
jgi:EAL domain-containing protein (putative c-di-GMP-specific phosphodiesterase class I)